MAQAAALRERAKQRVELPGVVLQQAGCGWTGAAGGHRRGGSWQGMAEEQGRGNLHRPQQTTVSPSSVWVGSILVSMISFALEHEPLM